MITPSFSPTATERVLPKLALDFTTASLDPRVTFTRALNTATCVNSSGNIATVNADLPRFDYDPTTLACKGLLIEESRTNGILNNTMQGAVAGTPGTSPTNWGTFVGGGLSQTIVGTGTENGIAYIDYRFFGTASSASGIGIFIGGITNIAATSGQTWTASTYAKLVSGSFANLVAGPRWLLYEYNSSSAVVKSNYATTFAPTNASLISQRYTYSVALSGGTTAYVRPTLDFAFNNGAVIDFTLRLGLPQMELGAFATSVIPTTTTALTRNADVATMTGTNFSSWWAGNGSITVSVGNVVKTSYTTAVVLDNGSGLSGNAVMLQSNSANNKLDTVIYTSGAQTQINDTQAFSATSTKASMAVNTNYVSYATQGAATTVNAGTLTVPSLNRCVFGYEQRYGNFLNGCIKKFAYYSNVLIANEVQAFSK